MIFNVEGHRSLHQEFCLIRLCAIRKIPTSIHHGPIAAPKFGTSAAAPSITTSNLSEPLSIKAIDLQREELHINGIDQRKPCLPLAVQYNTSTEPRIIAAQQALAAADAYYGLTLWQAALRTTGQKAKEEARHDRT